MERMTQHYAIVRNMYCERDSRSTVTARSREELWAKILDGQRRLEIGDVMETGTREAVDPDEWKARQDELRRIERTTCLLPPPEDMMLVHEAKRIDPEDWQAVEAIDPGKASWPETRRRLEEIKRAKDADRRWKQLRQAPW